MSKRSLAESGVRHFQEKGYILLPNLFEKEEVDLLQRTARSNDSIEEKVLQRKDGEGGITKLRIWNSAGNDAFGVVARMPRVVEPMEQLLGGEVYFYHSKLIPKEPETGGAWAWHQDYGYWYDNGCLFPYLASCMIALDPSTKENGCLQVLEGSHHLGRIEHRKVGDQTGADPERVEEARKILPLVHCEMQSGDALFFHCNLLHRSDQNRSKFSRTTYLCCYNAARNDPYKEHHHPRYHPLEKVADSALKGLEDFQPATS